MKPRNSENEEEKKESVEKLGEDDEEILWVTDFDEGKVKEFTESLFKASAKDSKKPIIIYIDSYGGAVDALSAMVAAIDTVPNKIITVAMGKAMSCGAMLFSYGDVRYASPYARIMVHEVSAGAFGNVNDMKVTTHEVTRINDFWMTWLAKNCGKSLKQLLKGFTNKKRDIYMNAEEAIKFGIADKIGFPKVKKVVRYEVE